MAANMIWPCSTSSRSPISTSARWRTRASTSSTRATSSPIPTPPPTPIMTRSPASSRTNISTIGRATGSPAATGSSCRSRKASPSFATSNSRPTRARRRSSGSRMCAMLRAAQFPEDAGPLAHPVRPESYIEISNFYTATVYNKGAEVIRMMHTMLGPEKFRAGSDLYFDRHDGAGRDLRGFRRARWRMASGVDLAALPPLVLRRRARRGSARALDPCGRRRPRASDARAGGAADARASPTSSRCRSRCASPCSARAPARSMPTGWSCSTDARQEIVFDGIGERPVLSINRDFSAPVIVETDRSRRRPRLPLGARRRSVRPLRGDAAADARHVDRRGRERPGRSCAR